MTKIFVLEDDPTTELALEAMLEDNGYTIISSPKQKDKAIARFEAETPDLVMLDINIHGKPLGIELAEIFQGIRAVPIIFLTAYKEKYFPDAKLRYPAAFFSKPYNEQDLLSAIELSILNQEKAQTGLSPNAPQFVWLKYDGAMHKIGIDRVLYGEADNVYISLTLEGKSRPLVLTAGLSEFLRKHAVEEWMQVHRSWFVHTRHITSFTAHEVGMSDGAKIPVSKTYAEALKARLVRK